MESSKSGSKKYLKTDLIENCWRDLFKSSVHCKYEELAYNILIFIFKTVFDKLTMKKMNYFQNLVAYWRTLIEFSKLENDFFCETISKQHFDENIFSQKIKGFSQKLQLKFSENIFFRVSETFQIRILIRNKKKIENMKQYGKIGCPITIYLLLRESDIEILYPYEDNVNWENEPTKNTNLKKKKLLNKFYCKEDCKKCNSVNFPKVKRENHFHQYCKKCFKENKYLLQCQICKKYGSLSVLNIYDSKLVNAYLHNHATEKGVYFTKFTSKEKIKFREELMKEGEKCQKCNSFNFSINNLCVYCDLNEKIVSKIT